MLIMSEFIKRELTIGSSLWKKKAQEKLGSDGWVWHIATTESMDHRTKRSWQKNQGGLVFV